MAEYWKPDGTPIEDHELDDMTDEWIDAVHGGEVEIAGRTFTTSRALKGLDHLAWREQQDLMVYAMGRSGELLYEEPELCSECGEVIDDGVDDGGGRDGMCADCADAAEESEGNDDLEED